MKVHELFATRTRTFSFEFFPPKTDKGLETLYSNLETLARLRPDYCSVTCGAAGGNRDKTIEIAAHINRRLGTLGVAHITCSWASRAEIRRMLDDARDQGLETVLALRGDPPKGQETFQRPEGGFAHACELVRMIRQEGYPFSVGVGGYPEGHVEAQDKQQDLEYLKLKVDEGADFIVTQLFFDNAVYFRFVERARALGIRQRIIPGIMPVVNYGRIVEFCKFCGSQVPEQLRRRMEPIAEDAEKVQEAGACYAAEQIRELLAGGAPGAHLYTLNQAAGVQRIFELLDSDLWR